MTGAQGVTSSVAEGIGESIWLVYLRLLGAVTTGSIVVMTFLHQLECELTNEPTHWLAAFVIVGAAAFSFVTLVSSSMRPSKFLTAYAAFCAASMVFCLFLLELCDLHYAFCLTLICINVAGFRLFMSGEDNEEDTGSSSEFPDDPGDQDGARLLAIGATNDLSASAGVDDSVEMDRLSDQGTTASNKPIWMRHPGWCLAGIGFIIYMIVVPTIGLIIDWLTPVTSQTLSDMTVMEWIRLHTVSGVVMLMFLGMGASIGSFLNVVIYRLPRRMPLLWPPSACAGCNTKLSGKDNIPVIAWLKLGGRCKYCDVPISVRYPIIEAIVAIVFVAFYFRELLSGGANLPVRTPNFYHGIVWILLYTKWDLVSLYFYHMILLVLLLAWGMINHDRFRVPTLSVVITCVVFMTLAALRPHLNPTSANWSGVLGSIPPSVLATIVGCFGGLGLGWLLSRMTTMKTPTNEIPATETPLTELATPESEASSLDQDPVMEVAEQREAELSAELLPEPVEGDAEALESLVNPSKGLYGAISKDPTTTSNEAASLGLVGAAMGIEAVIVVVLLTGLFYFASPAVRMLFASGDKSIRNLPATVYVYASSVVVLFLWNFLYYPITSLAG